MNIRWVHDELYGSAGPRSSCCNRAELTAFLRGHCRLRISGEGCEIEVYSCNAQLARRIYHTFRQVHDISAEIRLKRNPHSYRRKVYLIEFKAREGWNALDIKNLGLLPGTERQKIDAIIVRNKCCSCAYVTASFLRSGSIQITSRRGYHLEFAPLQEEDARFLEKLADGLGLKLKKYMRNNSFVLYSKNGDIIARFMSLAGAHEGLLRFENLRAMRETRENINRTVNFETANLGRSIKLAEEQVDHIKKMKKSGMLDKLPEKLLEAARLRLIWPYADLRELAEKAQPPLSKSGIRYRLNKIMGYPCEG